MLSKDLSGHEGSYRLHPLSVVFRMSGAIRALILPGLAVVILARGEESDIWLMVLFGPAVVYAVVRYLTVRYELHENEIVIRQGLFFRSVRHIPYHRIQNLNLVQNVFHRVLGVVELRIETAGGAEAEAELRVLSAAALAEIRSQISGYKARVDEKEESPPDMEPEVPGSKDEIDLLWPPVDDALSPRLLYQMNAGEIARLGLISNRGLLMVAALIAILTQVDLLESSIEWLSSVQWLAEWITWSKLLSVPLLIVLAVVGTVLLLRLFSLVWSFLRFHDFRLVLVGNDLQTHSGLFTQQTVAIPRHRVQRLVIRESLLHRWFGRVSVKAETAGGKAIDPGVGSRWLVPLAPRHVLQSILDAVRYDVNLNGVDWLALAPRASRRMGVRYLLLLFIVCAAAAAISTWWVVLTFFPLAPLAMLLARLDVKHRGYALTPSAFLVREGWYTRKRVIIPYSKVQTVSLGRSPFDRRHRMATLRVVTAGPTPGTPSVHVPFLTLSVALRILQRLRLEAESHELQW